MQVRGVQPPERNPLTGLLPSEEGTRWFFGKPYHWVKTKKGLRLAKGEVADGAL